MSPRILALILLSLALGGSTHAAAPTRILAPIVAQRAQLAAALPDTLTVSLPFTVLDSPTLDPEEYAGPLWRVVVYRVDSGSLNGGWQLEVNTATNAVRAVEQQTFEQPNADGRYPNDASQLAQNAVVRPAAKLCTSQLSQRKASDNRIYVWCLPSTTGRATTLRIQVTP